MAENTLEIKDMHAFLQQNPDFDILSFKDDDTQAARFNWQRLNKEKCRNDLQVCQETLVKKGFDSVFKLTALSKNRFIAECGPLLGGYGNATARAIYTRAENKKNQIMHMWAAAHNVTSPHFKALKVNHLNAQIAESFEGLPSFRDFFGSLDFCDCAECKSIFGPAAYFVDLMRITEKYINQPNIKTIPEGMALAVRRPDLDKIKLTCENTNRTIPYLEIVNERLEELVGRLSGNRDQLYQSLAQAHYPFHMPFHLPLERIRIYLKQLKVQLAEIYTAMEAGAQDRAAEYLGLSPEEWQLLGTAHTDDQQLNQFYGVSDWKLLTDAGTFCRQTGLSFNQLQALLYQNLTDDEIEFGLTKQFFINQGLPAPLRIETKEQNQTIINLNKTALDQIHRFLRLCEKTGWDFTQLDWALHCVGEGTPAINEEALRSIAGIRVMTENVNITVDTACSLLFDLKTYGEDEPLSLTAPFDQVFNGPGLPAYQPVYAANPRFKQDCWQWQAGADDSRNHQIAVRIAAGLGMRQDDIAVIAATLFPGSPDIALTVENLSTLYRHAKLADILKLPVAAYVKFLEIFDAVQPVFDIDRLTGLLAAADTLRRSGLNIFELDYIVNGQPSQFVDTLYREQDVDIWLTTLPSLTQSTAVTEHKRQLEQQEKIIEQLATFFNVQAEQINVFFPLLEAITGNHINIAAVFLPMDPRQKATALAIMQKLSRYLVVAGKFRLTTAEIQSMQAHPENYGIDNQKRKKITPQNVLDIFRFKEQQAGYCDTGGSLLAFMNAGNAADAAPDLASLTHFDQDQIKLLLAMFTDTNRIDKFDKISRVIKLSQKIGINCSLMQSMKELAGKNVTTQWNDYNAVADNLMAAVKARYAADLWHSIYSQINGEEQERKRQALTGTALNMLSQSQLKNAAWIKNTRNLYEYLLIDVEMSGCAEISYIKEALNAVQLYLNRCRQKLEPGINDLSIPEIWWEWMMNYRVWEANRRIFLYPENYLDPAYRSAKTELFKELENTLKQGDIKDKTVGDAYKKYLESFAELAKLIYVDAYCCNIKDNKRNDAPTLFLFARTQTQPYTYYYIMQEAEGTWSEWNKIKITINAEQITPVYVFDRLFIFWVEQKREEKRDDSTGSAVYKTTIRYTFYNFSEDWVQPQTIIEDQIIAVQNSRQLPNYNNLIAGSLFDPDSLWWHKVYALKIEQSRYWLPGNGANRFEKIILLYGPMVSTEEHNGWQAPDLTNPPSTADEFSYRLYQTAVNFKFLLANGYQGHLPVFPAIVINDDLEPGFLVNPHEFIFLQNEAPQSSTYFRPNIDRSSGRLNLIASHHTIHSNYDENQIHVPAAVIMPEKMKPDAFAAPEAGLEPTDSEAFFQQLVNHGYIDRQGMATAIDFSVLSKDLEEILAGQPGKEQKIKHILQVVSAAAGTPWLSSMMRYKSYEVIPVKNHPTALVFKGEKEAFLLCDPAKNVPLISRGLFNAATLFKRDAFISAALGMDQTSSNRIFDQLVKAGYLSQEGLLLADMDSGELYHYLKELLAGQPRQDDQVAAVYNILLHQPVFTAHSFLSSAAGIDAAASQAFFIQLTNKGFLDSNGRLDGDADFYGLSQTVADFLQGQPEQETKVRHVVDTLYQCTFPASVGFFADREQNYGLHEYKFATTRMTTAAVHRLSQALFTGGIDRLLRLDSQQIPVESELPFQRFEFNKLQINPPAVEDGAQVDFYGTYGLYYWELFFHSPLYISNVLKTNQKYQDAERWLKYIFNPTLAEDPIRADSFQTSTIGLRDSKAIYKILLDQGIVTPAGAVSSSFTAETKLDQYLKTILNQTQINAVKNILLNYQLSNPAARFWQFQPFRNQTLETLQAQLTNPQEIAVYNATPFDPHAIARLRVGAYEKAVVMQYVNVLLDWGDYLFSQYTWESITSATMLYMYAYNLLGDRPENLGPGKTHIPVAFKDIAAKYQTEIPQFLIDLEQQITADVSLTTSPTPFNEFDAYFCIPENGELLAYWDRVEDRLYKIRHCLNINGLKQSLALFEPRLDPDQLARIASAGGDVLAVLENSAPLPHYRFNHILEKAKNVTAVLSQLGNNLLGIMEKKDSEALALLRSTHEKMILNLTTLSKEKQREETTGQIAALQESLNSARYRLEHYQHLYDENLNTLEIASLTLMGAALYPQYVATCIRGLSVAGYLAPNIFGLADGGMNFGEAINTGAQMADGTAGILSHTANIIATGAQYVRRREEWELQIKVARYEIEQLTGQITASQARSAYLQRELEIHQLNIKQADEYEDFLKNKFTNSDLYQWMLGRISTVYFQTYRIALSMASAAQAAYQNELNCDDQFIQYNYWDSLRKGLLAGESLMLSLHQMEKAYIENNSRVLEIEKTISLLHLNPQNFLEFKLGINNAPQGVLNFELSEKLFDFDFPGHYCRKIKSISVSIPAVVGPYQNINATLRQNSNTIIMKPNIDAVHHVLDPNYTNYPPNTLREDWLPNQQIALSRGIDDAGLFVLDFRDERYLPFEGTGAVSKWTLSLPPATNRINFAALSDVIIHIKYTAQEGGGEFAGQVKALLYSGQPPYPYTLAKCIDLKQAYPEEWLKFINTPPAGGIQQIAFPLTDNMILPNLNTIQLHSINVLLYTPAGQAVSEKDIDSPFLILKTKDGTGQPVSIKDNCGTVRLSGDTPLTAGWLLEFDITKAPDVLLDNKRLNPAVLLNVIVLVNYESNVFGKP